MSRLLRSWASAVLEGSRVLRGEQWAARLQQRLPNDGRLQQWMRTDVKLLKEDQTSQVGLLELDGESCYLKHYRGRTPLQSTLYRQGRGRPTRAFDGAAALWQAGVSVPRPLCCLSVPGGAVLLAEGIADARDLQDLARENGLGVVDKRMLEAVASLLACLHGAGYAHGDCKWSNLLCAGAHWYLVDLDGVSPCREGSPKQARDIARFTLNAEEMTLSREHFEHFLDTYVKATEWTRETLLTAVVPFLEKFRRRHRERYGVRGHRLVSASSRR